jgi:hypothetical protein
MLTRSIVARSPPLVIYAGRVMPPVPADALLALRSRLGHRVEFMAALLAQLAEDGRVGEVLSGHALGAHRAAYASAYRQNRLRMDALDRILAAQQARGLRCLPIKGALLARTLYADLGARPMSDLDLLCEPAALEAQVSLLSGLGFRVVDRPAWREALGAIHDVRLSDGVVLLELHVRLWHELRLPSEVAPVLARAVPIRFGELTVLGPSVEDHVFIVLVHAALHALAGNPLWITDAALLAAGDAQVWPRALDRARQYAAELPFLVAYDHLARSLPGLALPALLPHKARRRRALLGALSPWLERGEGELGLLPSRVVKPLLFEEVSPLVSWSVEKLRSFWAQASGS